MEPNTKGYGIKAAMTFILANPEIRAKIPSGVVQEFTRVEPTLSPVGWYPRSQLKAVYEALAKTQSTEAEAYSLLERCGTATAEGATSSYMKLVLKILTPRMFASKFPDFWGRDHQNGRATVEFFGSDHHMLFRVYDVGGFSHIGPISAGFVKYLMTVIGEKGVQVTCDPWSLANPGPSELPSHPRGLGGGPARGPRPAPQPHQGRGAAAARSGSSGPQAGPPSGNAAVVTHELSCAQRAPVAPIST